MKVGDTVQLSQPWKYKGSRNGQIGTVVNFYDAMPNYVDVFFHTRANGKQRKKPATFCEMINHLKII